MTLRYLHQPVMPLLDAQSDSYPPRTRNPWRAREPASQVNSQQTPVTAIRSLLNLNRP